jgi:ribosomal protein L10
MPAKTDKQLRKEKVWSAVQTCCVKYEKCIFVNVDNVTSKQICIMRKALRAIDAQMVMGKNVSYKTRLLINV